MGYFYDIYVENALVKQNQFKKMAPDTSGIPLFNDIKEILPQPFWDGHEQSIRCYWKAWELAFKNIKKADESNGFVSNYLATCFNDCLFMWDSVFALMFGKYGIRAFNFQQTINNLYAKQHPDGFICREIAEADGTDRFHRFEPSSTGPNILPWLEWEYFLFTNDKERLEQIYPVLLAYHQWLKAYRTWPDGSYWSSGWGAGLDNQPRIREKGDQSQSFYHGHMSWMDACIQALLSAKLLIEISKVLDKENETTALKSEVDSLTAFVNEKLWNNEKSYYFDLYADKKLSDVKTISAYWALLADIIPADRIPSFIKHLEDKASFNRVHRVPSMPADAMGFCAEGNYWRGGVWVFTNYMLLKGLTNIGFDTLAYDIALNHLENVVNVFEKTGTIWENYAPEAASPGNPAKPDFVGAGGITPIAIMLEYVFGLRPDAINSKLVWDVRRLEAHGVNNYPLGADCVLSLKCDERSDYNAEPQISVITNKQIELEIRWGQAQQMVRKVLYNPRTYLKSKK